MKNSNSTSKLIHHRKHISRVQETKPDYAFARADIIGAGEWRAQILEVRASTTKRGELAADFCYELTPTNRTRQTSRMMAETRFIMERFPIDGYRLESLLARIEELSRQTLNDPFELTALIGLGFDAEISYPDPGGFGNIEYLRIFKLPPGIADTAKMKLSITEDGELVDEGLEEDDDELDNEEFYDEEDYDEETD